MQNWTKIALPIVTAVALFLLFINLGRELVTINPGALVNPADIGGEVINDGSQEQQDSSEEQKSSDVSNPEAEGEKGELTSNETEEPAAPATPAATPISLPPITNNTNITVRAATVNILCTAKSGGSLNPSSGSGIIIDPRGVILTNAHAAQYFLLNNYPVKDFIDCVVRGGSPAKSLYRARILYLPPEWINENKENIKLPEPLGTGENDYALLLIEKRTDEKTPLPSSFPSINVDTDNEEIHVGRELLFAGYPSEFLGGITITKDLYITSTIMHVMKLFTFGSGTIDVFSLGGSIAAQKGSSGSGLVTGDEKLHGIVVTLMSSETTAGRDLRAITTGHIDRSLRKFTGLGLKEFLVGDLSEKTNVFNNTVAPGLTNTLVEVLERN